jgi:hypothetical protein
VLKLSAPVGEGEGSLKLFVSELSVELPLIEFVSISEGLLALSVPTWPLAETPVPVVSVVSVAPISPVSLRAQPAKQIKVAAINANFFIVQLLVCARESPPERCVQRAIHSHGDKVTRSGDYSRERRWGFELPTLS